MGRAEAHRGDHKPTPLQVVVDAMNLHAHTCHIMSNAKVFNPAEDFNSMTLVHIFETTLEIYTRLYEANSIRVGDDPLLARERLELGNFAQVAADKLPALQDLAKRQFKKLRRTPSKFWYWASKAVALKDAIKAWRESERRGEVERGATEDSYRCVRACMTKGNSARLLRRMDDFANELIKEIDNAKDETI